MTKNTAIMSKTVEILGEQAGYYLSHVCRTIDKKSLYLPGPDTVDRIWAESDRSVRTLGSLQWILSNGRLGGTGYVSILLWKTGIFNSQFGLLNQWMQKLGLATVRWLANDVSAFLCCTVVNLWLALPFMIMIMDGALQAVDHSCYEGAILDGANWFQRAYFITIPAIRPIIAPSVLITVFTTFKQFDVVYLLTQQAGAKTGANIHTILTYAYENAFITNNYGYSSAVSILIFAILILFSMVTSRKAKEG